MPKYIRENTNADIIPPMTALVNVRMGLDALCAISNPIPVTEEMANMWLKANTNIKPITLSPKPKSEAGFIAMTLHDIKTQIANTRIGNQTPAIDSHFR